MKVWVPPKNMSYFVPGICRLRDHCKPVHSLCVKIVGIDTFFSGTNLIKVTKL